MRRGADLKMVPVPVPVFIVVVICLTVTSSCTTNTNTKSIRTESSRKSFKQQSPVGPPYPVTAAWFKDRWTLGEWHDTLNNFIVQGGNSVFLRAPPVVVRTRDDLAQDVNFRWCGSYKSSSGSSGPRCYDEAIQELEELGGLKVTAFLTYQYEEGYSDAIMRCPKLDRKINSSRVYYRIVLPAVDSVYSKSDPCSFANGSNVVVLFTSFSGVDPHQLLLEAAAAHTNVSSVYFGLPGMPESKGTDLSSAYYAWVERVLMEHRSRFSKITTRKSYNNDVLKRSESIHKHIPGKNMNENKYYPIQPSDSALDLDKESGEMFKLKSSKVVEIESVPTTLYDVLAGYNTQADHSMGEWLFILYTVNELELLGEKVGTVQKRFAVSATVNTNKGQVNSTLQQHVEGFLRMVNTGIIDVIIVQDGRGMGKGAYFWPHERLQPVAKIDPVLSKVLRYQNRTLSKHATFDQVFIASNQEVFAAFRKALDQSNPGKWNDAVEFWLGLEAFEFLRDDPCLPIDPNGSGLGQIFNRATKRRVDQSLSVAGAKVHKVISSAWDPDFTCVTNNDNASLHSEIMADLSRPIIANCSFHSPRNLSVVVIGFNLEAETQGFTVEWKDARGRSKSTPVNGYYFELDYGEAHHLVASLQYVMLWDIPAMFPGLAPDGTISVAATGGNTCYFQYSLPDSGRTL